MNENRRDRNINLKLEVKQIMKDLLDFIEGLLLIMVGAGRKYSNSGKMVSKRR